MLHRLPSSALLIASRHATASGGVYRAPVCPRARQWLTAPGSLTARLRQHGKVEVRVMRQGHQRLWAQEQIAIGSRVGHVREVVLTLNGQPAVWARSVTSPRGLKGPWRALKGLGARPLAELLFEHRGVARDPLWGQRLSLSCPEHAHLLRSWRSACAAPAPAWVRRSVFWHKGQALQVMESFAPWVLALPVAHTPAQPFAAQTA